MLIETIGNAVERFLGEQSFYSPLRMVALCVSRIAAPAIALAALGIIIRKREKWLKYLTVAPVALNFCLVLSCFFGPWCFSFDSGSNTLVPGPLYVLPQFLPVIYVGILAVFSIANLHKSRWESVIVLVGSIFVIANFVNEVYGFIPADFRAITIAVSVLAYFLYYTSISHIEEVEEISETYAETEERHTREMLDETIETLAFTIDAKDRYTKGHSSRVAKYSRMIGQVLGKSEEECRQIYRTGLLHDIGKISISGSIINKPGKLTDEEYAIIKKHPEMGAKILDKMKSIPYLHDGAKYHHERYDGKGYPSGLKGEEIPEIARIIAVADAYDAMTSYRSYREAMDQVLVKQELWKGMGTQFDALFAKIMISLVDADVYYDMREKKDVSDEIMFEMGEEEIKWPIIPPKDIKEKDTKLTDSDFTTLGAFMCVEDHWCNPSKGIPVAEKEICVTFRGVMRPDGLYVWNTPVVLLFASTDGEVMGPAYDELGVFMSAGYGWRSGSAVYEYSGFTRNEGFVSWDNWIERNRVGLEYTVRIRREGDEVILEIANELITTEANLKLAKGTKNVFFALSGEYCDVYDIKVAD